MSDTANIITVQEEQENLLKEWQESLFDAENTVHELLLRKFSPLYDGENGLNDRYVDQRIDEISRSIVDAVNQLIDEMPMSLVDAKRSGR